MLSLSRVLTLLVAAFAVAAVVAVPSRTTTDDDPHVNPVGIITRSLRPKSAVYLTNAQRLARGLPLNNPPKPSPRPSHKPSPRPSSSPACVAKTGYIEAKVEGQATGYVSMNTNVYGEYEFTTDASEALSVSLSYCADKKDTFDIMTLNGAADFDYLGFITGSSNHGTKRDLDQGSYNYAYLGGVHKERRGPAVRADNTFTCATGLKESVESNVWSVNGDKYLSVSWVNTDKSTPCVTVLYFSDDNNFVITADPEKYMKTFGGGEITVCPRHP
ncbi:hypothetical protein L226DRAFT_472813 [Lentinus tigrinus ALCF2SS1-7]|uniref:uncharacterized protein n=1 Tax=Lentinus tigrinus ALCF2SS1-7 TaxID=1328758 RepID=UPI001165DBC4|nr:hypothetical protein L226DRAFT_472813 [Lentinus tigrinus ALCF2SS1-7]